MRELFTELWALLKAYKKYWLIPTALVLLLYGALIVWSHGSAVASPVYRLF